VRDGGRVVGLVVELAADRPDARDGDRRRAADLPPPLPGLVGVSPSWRGLLRRVAAVGSAPAVVVIGEPGSGTTSVADAMTGGQEVARLDAAEAVLGEPGTWLAGLATAVRSEHPVVLMDADRLPADLAPSVALLLEQHPPVRLVLAGRPPGPGRPWWRSLLRNGCEELVEVPPLRDRVEDLPGLLALGPGPALRFTVDAGTALRRYRWPGNVAELRRLVDRLRIGVGNRRAIGLEDLPEDVAAALHGRWIGELEQAELRAIRAHDGNRARAAVALGISRATLYRKLHHYGVTGR
jgi:DNA-binding NtrC family response regulator